MSDRDSKATQNALFDRLPSTTSDGRSGTDSLNRSQRSRTSRSSDHSDLFWTLVSVQAGWMVLMLVLLFTLEMWSLELYYIVSFHGLLGARLLFAPTNQEPTWWRRLNWVVYAGFVLLMYLIVQNLNDLPA